MTNAQSKNENLMVVVDESAATRRAVDYVTRMIGCQRGFHVYLLHLLPPLPAELLEFGGAEDPGKKRNCKTNSIVTSRLGLLRKSSGQAGVKPSD